MHHVIGHMVTGGVVGTWSDRGVAGHHPLTEITTLPLTQVITAPTEVTTKEGRELGNTVNEWAVRILLEYIFITILYLPVLSL